MKAKVFLLSLTLLALPIGLSAQGWKNNNRKEVRSERRYNERVSYHRPGRTVRALPYGYSPVRYHDVVYYYANGVYYRPTRSRYFEIVYPPIGVIVPDLPHYKKVRCNGRTYYAYQNYLYSRIKTPYGISYRVDVRL